MYKENQIAVSNCNPQTYPGSETEQVVENLKNAGLYTKGHDEAKAFTYYLNRIPSSILVAKEVGHDDTVLGSVYVPFSLIPLIGRRAVNEKVVTDAFDKREVTRVLFNAVCDELRSREQGWDWEGPRLGVVEELHDSPNPPPPLAGAAAAPYEAEGFKFGWHMFGVVRNLWQPDGQPTDPIPYGFQGYTS